MIGHVFKYEIPLTDELIEIEMPDNYAICDVNNQDDSIYIWAMVDIHAPLFKNKFKIFGTAHKIDDVEGLYFLKTVHMPNGLVWHVFALGAMKDE